MKQIINWLIDVEERAARCYEKAAAFFSEDKELAGFLIQLAEDERRHREIMGRAAESIKDKKHLPFFMHLDDDSKQKILQNFVDLERDIAQGALTKQDIFDYLVTAEFSEWNDIFLYVVNSLKGSDKFIHEAAGMQQHKRRIERFLESDPELGWFVKRIKGLPRVWQERILVVDNSEMIIDLYSSILKEEGIIDGAANGKEALEKLSKEYYTAIITDVEMPVMGGIEFYKKAVETYPHIRDRIIFTTAYKDTEKIVFFRRNGLRYLLKPVPLKELKKAVVDILTRYGS
jgi:CheY-like chemotaxis protein